MPPEKSLFTTDKLQRCRCHCLSLTGLLFSLWILGGCASLPVDHQPELSKPSSRSMPAPNTALLAGEAPLPSPQALLTLTAAQQDDFLDYFHGEAVRPVPKHHRIRDFLHHRLAGFGYLEESLTASEAMAEHRGNCVSLAALTLALADLVGVEIRFQLMTTAPVFDRDGGLILSSNHVRSRLYDPDYEPNPGVLTLQRPHVQIDYFPGDRRGSGKMLSRDEFLALFYRNLAADALVINETDRAFAMTQAALALDPDHADSLNLMAVIHRRAGDLATADQFYRHATRLHRNHINLLSNHESLLRQLGQDAEADELVAQLAQLDDPNPFHWLDLGERARQRGSLHAALRWYGEALARAPYLHEAYWRQAIVYEELGQPDRSLAALEKAHSLTLRPDLKKSYQSKWMGLKTRPVRTTGGHDARGQAAELGLR